ncbi:hypothetical protein WB904_002903 [Vibrio parahaemolyticus]
MSNSNAITYKKDGVSFSVNEKGFFVSAKEIHFHSQSVDADYTPTQAAKGINTIKKTVNPDG